MAGKMYLIAVLFGCFLTSHTLPANGTEDEISTPPGAYVSKLGFVKHVSSKFFIGTEAQCPRGRFNIGLWGTREQDYLQYRFYQIEGHLG